MAGLSSLVAALAVAGSAAGAPLFVDRGPELGLDFVHWNGMTGRLYFAENMGAGAALFDYDGDGDLDAFLVQGAMLEPGKSPKEATFPPPAQMRPPSDRLYRNDLLRRPDGTLEPRFVDVTREVGIAEEDYGMAVAVGDADGDGALDLFVANFGADRLWRNQGDGTFEDWTARAGVSDPFWSTAATFFDADSDGREDLYVANYVDFRVATHSPCYAPDSSPDYCGPSGFGQEPDRLYRNLGDGRFEDVTAKAGITAQAGTRETAGAGLGAVASDVDGDRDQDLYVANDKGPNFLWINRGNGTFEETGLLAGVALNEKGNAEASMGIAVGDIDGDADEDLLVTNLSTETNTLYVNDGGGLFHDGTLASGLGPPSLPFTSFGVQWLDFDNNGRLDLFVASGEVKRIEAQVRSGSLYPLAQRNQLFRQRVDGRFDEVSPAEAGEPFSRPGIYRGAAFGDVDNDGDIDILVTANSGPALLLLNQVGADAPWLGIDAPIGTRLELTPKPGAKAQTKIARRDGSYASASDGRVVFGLGSGPFGDGSRLLLAGRRPLRYLRLPLRTYLTPATGR